MNDWKSNWGFPLVVALIRGAMMLATAVAIVAVVPSCATVAELTGILDDVIALRETFEDRDATWADVGEKVDDLAENIEEVKEDVEARGEAVLTAGELAGGGSIAIALAMAALNRYRDSRRRKRGEIVAVPRDT